MRLMQELALPQARVIGVGIEPAKTNAKVVLAVRTNLTREVAEAFGCRDLIYAGQVPRTGVDRMKLEGEELDCAVHFQHDRIAFSAMAGSIGNFVAKMEGDGPKLLFRIKLSGYASTCADLAEKVEIDPLLIMLKPAQMDLGLKEVKPPEEKQAAVADEHDFLAELEAEITKGRTA